MEEIKINKLEVEDGWTLWKFQIKVVLRAGGLWELVSGAVTQPEADGEPRKQWIKDDAKAQKILVVSMGEGPLMHVINCETAAAMFATLESVYEQKSDTSIHLLQQQFFQYVKGADDSIAMHIAKLQKIARQLEDLGEKISENMLVTKILMTLPEQYNHFFAAWEATEKKDRTLKMLTARLCMEESRLGVQPNTQGAFVASQVKGKGDNKKKGKCFICKKFGHWKRDCPNKENGKKLAHGNAFVSEVMFVQSSISRESSWYMDSGASDHMSYRKEWFHDYVKFDTPKDVRIADGSIVQAYGRGDIHVKAYNGNVWNAKYLADVLYVPGIKMNLFSSNACLDKGYSLIAEGNACYFKKQGKVWLQGVREDSKLFKLLLKVNGVEAEANFSAKSESLQLWHERMCHQAKDHVKSVLTQRSISFNSNDFFCEGCVFGKQHRLPFHESKNRANSIGELVHTDLCGPMQEISYGGARYMLLFRDDFSNYRCVYCIKSKADVALYIERFLDKTEAETGKQVQCIRSDNGLEFVNKDVAEIFGRRKVIHQKSTPYTPEHNGRAERDMRTVIEGARSMIHAKELSLKYWGEAVNNIVYTLNRSGKCQVDGKSPFELWFNKQADLSVLRVFGSKAFVHIPQEKRRKFNAKSKKGVFVGYEENCKGYRVWIPNERKIEVSRDVIIKETYKAAAYVHEEQAEADSSVEEPTTNADKPETITDSCDNHDSEGATNQPQLRKIMTRSQRREIESKAALSYAYVAEADEPDCYEKAVSSNHCAQWKRAMDEEPTSLITNQTWSLVSLPTGRTAISNKWVYKVKRGKEGEIERFKARLVARGFTQKFGTDYFETFSPVAKFTSIRIILAMSVELDMIVKQFDVKTAFLYGTLNEEIYMHQPTGYEDGTDKVCKLNKSLYGLKQASRCWNQKFTQILETCHLKVSAEDPCVFIGSFNSAKLILAIYIDDGIIAAQSTEALCKLIDHLTKDFDIKVFESIFYLGMEVVRKSGKIFIQQKAYATKVLERFGMLDAKPVTTPAEGVNSNTESSQQVQYPYREAVGSLMYLSTVTRPDLAYAVSYASRFLDTYTSEHIVLIKRIFRYLRGTLNEGILFEKVNNLSLTCFSDSDFAGDLGTRRSTGGYVIMLCGGPISWSSKIQQTVALSTTEAEYMAACESVKELIWVRRLLEEMSGNRTVPELCLDNQSAIKLVKNPQYHKRTKHIEVKFHFIREVYENKGFMLKYVPTNTQLADIFTKPLKNLNFNNFKSLLKVCSFFENE